MFFCVMSTHKLSPRNNFTKSNPSDFTSRNAVSGNKHEGQPEFVPFLPYSGAINSIPFVYIPDYIPSTHFLMIKETNHNFPLPKITCLTLHFDLNFSFAFRCPIVIWLNIRDHGNPRYFSRWRFYTYLLNVRCDLLTDYTAS